MMKFLFRKPDYKSNQTEIEIHMSKNFGLSPVEFDQLLSRLREGDENLFENVFLAQFKNSIDFLCKGYKIEHEIAYDIVMDTLILFRHKLLEGKIVYGNLQYLFNTMARQLYLKSLQKKPTTELFDHDFTEENHSESLENHYQNLEKAWTYLNVKEKQILEKFYYLKIPLNVIALEQNVNEASLRKQKQRALEKLKLHFNQLFIQL